MRLNPGQRASGRVPVIPAEGFIEELALGQLMVPELPRKDPSSEPQNVEASAAGDTLDQRPQILKEAGMLPLEAAGPVGVLGAIEHQCLQERFFNLLLGKVVLKPTPEPGQDAEPMIAARLLIELIEASQESTETLRLACSNVGTRWVLNLQRTHSESS